MATPHETTLPLAPEILAAIARNATILTPSQRSARTLRRAYASAQSALGQTQWTPPQIFAIDTWLPSLWRQLLLAGHESRILLNSHQEHSLWRAIIAADREVSGLRSPDTLASLATRAWRLLHLHNGREQLADAAHSTDTRAFDRWSRTFDRLCTRELYLTSAQLPAALSQAHARGDLDLPNAGLALIDFDPHPPAIASLLHAIESAGYDVANMITGQQHLQGVPHDHRSEAEVIVGEVPTQPEISTPHLHPLSDPTTELRTAAIWSYSISTANPHKRIAIVVPNLADRRPELERTFAEILPAGTYEFSLGIPLAQTSLAATFLDLLRWPLEALPLDRITALLLSPHFAPQSEAPASQAIAEFDARDLRQAKLLRPELSLEDTIEILGKSQRKTRLSQLHNRLRTLRKAALAANLPDSTQQSHAHWAETFRSLLPTAPEDSLAFQTHRRWESALDNLATLDFNGLRLNARDALESLTRIATQTIFAPESANAPIQILGPLELGAVPFDALWFLSADDRTWPVPAAPNPLLPFQLQQSLSMPAADPAHDNLLAQSLTARILRSAAIVHFSYATHAEDGPRRPSPLLKSLNLDPGVPHSSPAFGDEWGVTPIPYERHPDTTPIHPLPPTTVRGGATVLAHQAACSFRAFAEHRLHSVDLELAEPGLDSRDRGSIVHGVMQALWEALKSQQTLRALTPEARNQALDAAIEAALIRTQRQVRAPWDAAYLDVQRQRLRNLLHPWLDLELERPAFDVLFTEHEAKSVTIGPLTLDLRVDRIDSTPAGTLILDYKTGTAAPADWLSDRPDAPQLPLYAVLAASSTNELGAPHLASEMWVGVTPNPAATNLAGVAFALLRAGEDLDLKGFADTPSVFGKPTPNKNAPTLQAQIEDWHRILEDLAYAFATETPVPLPKSYPQTCKHCDQRILCRLDPATLPQFGDDEEDFTEVPTFA